ncbi:YtxH domain-containing protein [Paenibacillus sp. GCM10023250]|uniref:YtxH domain-containing protein n=1 Tax=Paenibacillus sp. GCM10023250 TaxID=3252648 RepID=UPI00361F8D79
MAKKAFMYGAIAGGVVGSVAALLLAPKSGRELRRDIADKTQTVTEQTARIAGQVGDKTVQVAKQVSSTASTAAVKVRDTAASVVDNVRGWRGDAKETLEDTGEQVMDVAEDVTDKGQELIAEHREELHTVNN